MSAIDSLIAATGINTPFNRFKQECPEYERRWCGSFQPLGIKKSRLTIQLS